MARLTDTAIVLRRWEYSETSQTVSLLTRAHGIVRGLAKGALRSNGSFSGGFEPMTRGHLGWIHKPGRELSTLTEWHLEDIFWPLRQQVSLNRAAVYAVDLVSRLLTDQDPHPDVHDALQHVLDTLHTDPFPEAHLLTFQWRMLTAIGWRPCIEQDIRTGEAVSSTDDVVGFSSLDGGVVNMPTDGDHRVRRSTITLLEGVDRGEAPSDAAAARRASALLAVYARDLLGDQSEAMRMAFPDVAV